jgi:hypothetical protein
MITFLVQFFGLDNGSSVGYLFWSGIGSDLSEIALIGALIGIYRKHQCHIDRCWRLARHPTGNGIVVCAKHHPQGPPSPADLIERSK